MENIKLYNKLIYDYYDYSNYVDYSNGRSYTSKLTDKKERVFNSNNTTLNYYINMINSFINNSRYLIQGDFEENDVIDLVLKLEKLNKLNCIKPELLLLASEIVYSAEDFLNGIKMLVIPKVYKEEDISRYYYIKNYYLEYYEDNKGLYNKYLKHDIDRDTFTSKFLDGNSVLYRSSDEEIMDAIFDIIIYHYDTHPVVDEQELSDYLIDFMKHPQRFYEELALNGFKFDETFYDEGLDISDPQFLRVVEHFYNTHQNQSRVIR